MKHLDLALATIALSIAVAAISYFSKDGAAAAFVGMVGMVFIWVNK